MSHQDREAFQPEPSNDVDRRQFGVLAAAGFAAGVANLGEEQEKGSQEKSSAQANQEPSKPKPIEAEFKRFYDPPKFPLSWKNPQINRLLVQDFVIFAHTSLEMVKKLLDHEPNLINATIDWGAGDWENALGGASHMGRKDIVSFLLSKGARMDLFCAAMMGKLDVVKSMLELQPALIDARGPHGFTLHFHAQVGQEDAKPVLDYLQSIKEIKLRPVPFLKKSAKKKK